jgi:hypothetical protein
MHWKEEIEAWKENWRLRFISKAFDKIYWGFLKGMLLR